MEENDQIEDERQRSGNGHFDKAFPIPNFRRYIPTIKISKKIVSVSLSSDPGNALSQHKFNLSMPGEIYKYIVVSRRLDKGHGLRNNLRANQDKLTRHFIK